jgi:hypothetical protein
MTLVRILVPKQGTPGIDTAGVVTLDVTTGSRTKRLNLVTAHDLHLNMGDTIKCISGGAVAMIDPGTSAGAYILTARLPLQNTGKYVTLLRINAETTRRISRGNIHVAEDIGNINHAVTATSR